MRCPHCGDDRNRVVDSRPAEDETAIRRRRHCEGCEQRFSTYERAEQLGLMVRKRDGALEPYERQKVLDGMRRALGSDVDGATVRAAAERVESSLRSLGRRHIPSAAVGAEVVKALRAVSSPAAIRFASVHQRFTSTEDFRRALADLEDDELSDYGELAAGFQPAVARERPHGERPPAGPASTASRSGTGDTDRDAAGASST